MKLNKEAYSKLIQEDIKKLENYFPNDSLEKKHILGVLEDSINFYYPIENNDSNIQKIMNNEY